MGFLNRGALMMILLVGGVLALVLGFAILVLYKRAIHLQMRSASVAGYANSDENTRRHPTSKLFYIVENLDQTLGSERRPDSPILLDSSLRCAAIYAAAGVAFGIASTILLLAFSDIEFLPLRTACVVWAYSWPVVLTVNLIWTYDRQRQLVVIAGYALVIVVFCLWSTVSNSVSTSIGAMALPAFLNPVLLWAIYAAPSLFLVLFLNKTVRAIGPVLLIFTSLLLLGWHIAMVLLGSSAGMRVAEAIFASTGLGAETVMLTVTVAGLVVGLSLGWIGIRWLADAYAARLFSEQILIIDSIWFLQSLVLCSSLAFERGFWGVAGLLAFGIYKSVTVFGFRRFSAKLEPQPFRLLLLRAFGFGRRSSRLFDLIAARWRYLGTIRLIAAPDLSMRTIEPGKLFAFLRGRLRLLFVRDQATLDERLAGMDESRDPDGRFRIAELFCAGEVWRSAVKKLMFETHLVIMDLRSFGTQHQGCVFELQTLLDTVPLERLVLLTSEQTQLEFLKQVLDTRWRELWVGSPNAQTAKPVCSFLNVNRWDVGIIHYLMRVGADFRRSETHSDQGTWFEPARPRAVR